ncbi:hypothetical protein CR513_49550, partial [Mucuna pruriens]
MATIFIDTLLSPFYDKVIRNVSSNFSDLVVVGERIKTGIIGVGFIKKPTPEKKKGEANAIGSGRLLNMLHSQRTLIAHAYLSLPLPRPYLPPCLSPYQPKPIAANSNTTILAT